MTTDYAQKVLLQARKEVEEFGYITGRTTRTLEAIGYDIAAIADLENRLVTGIWR